MLINGSLLTLLMKWTMDLEFIGQHDVKSCINGIGTTLLESDGSVSLI